LFMVKHSLPEATDMEIRMTKPESPNQIRMTNDRM
jgi:hypothetical protein